MNLVPLNKSAILEYGMLELLTKLWNLSKNMRKRLQRLLKGRVIVVVEYDYKLVVLGCWIRSIKQADIVPRKIRPFERLCSYIAVDDKDIQTILKVNGSLACNLSLSETISPTTFEIVPMLRINHDDLDYYLNLTFIRVNILVTHKLNSTQIQQILGRITYLDSLEINRSLLSDLDLASNHLKYLKLKDVTIEENVNLPFVLESIRFKDCEGINLLKFNKLRRFYFFTKNFKVFRDTIEMYHLFKVIEPENNNSEYKDIALDLPSSVRYIEGLRISEQIIPIIKARLPNLIGLEDYISFEIAQELNLRITSTSGLN